MESSQTPSVPLSPASGYVRIPIEAIRSGRVRIDCAACFTQPMNYLILGSGANSPEHGLRVDARPDPTIDISCDCAELDWLPENSINKAFSKYMFEHLPREHWQPTLRAVLRVLKPKGVYEVITPIMSDAVANARQALRQGVNIPSTGAEPRDYIEDRVFGRADPWNVYQRHKSWTAPDFITEAFNAAGYHHVRSRENHPGVNDSWVVGFKP